MRKLTVLFFVCLLLISFTSAQIGSLEGVEDKIEDLEDFGDKIPGDEDEAREVAFEYLKGEWTEILEKNAAGRFILFFSDLFHELSPVFKLVLGIGYSLSWLFFLVLGAWISVFIIIYRAIKDSLQFKWWIVAGISFIIPTIAAQYGIFEMFVGFFIPLFTNRWIITLAIVLVAVGLYAYTIFMKQFGEVVRERMKKDTASRRESKSRLLEKLTDISLRGYGKK